MLLQLSGSDPVNLFAVRYRVDRSVKVPHSTGNPPLSMLKLKSIVAICCRSEYAGGSLPSNILRMHENEVMEIGSVEGNSPLKRLLSALKSKRFVMFCDQESGNVPFKLLSVSPNVKRDESWLHESGKVPSNSLSLKSSS